MASQPEGHGLNRGADGSTDSTGRTDNAELRSRK